MDTSHARRQAKINKSYEWSLANFHFLHLFELCCCLPFVFQFSMLYMYVCVCVRVCVFFFPLSPSLSLFSIYGSFAVAFLCQRLALCAT